MKTKQLSNQGRHWDELPGYYH